MGKGGEAFLKFTNARALDAFGLGVLGLTKREQTHDNCRGPAKITP